MLTPSTIDQFGVLNTLIDNLGLSKLRFDAEHWTLIGTSERNPDRVLEE